MSCLNRQTIRESIEVVLVAPSDEHLDLDPDIMGRFFGHRVVEVGDIRSTGAVLAEGVRAATAPVVVYSEQHTYPHPEWAEALVKAHRGPWAAVGPEILNENPGTVMSWVSLLTDFGSWVRPNKSGEVSGLPGHHTCYKRDVLLGYGDDLEYLMESESVLLGDFISRGLKLYLETAAKSDHLNFSRFLPWVQAELNGGRLYGHIRARLYQWSVARRLFYTICMPLILLKVLLSKLKDARRCLRGSLLFPRVVPGICLGVLIHTFGEVLGYMTGPGQAAGHRCEYELHRELFINDQDRAALDEE